MNERLFKTDVVFDVDETSLLNWLEPIRTTMPISRMARAFSGASAIPAKTLIGDMAGRRSRSRPCFSSTRWRAVSTSPHHAPRTTCSSLPTCQIEHNYELASVWMVHHLDTAGCGTVSPDHLYVRDANSSGSVAGYKSAACADIESKGFTIIANGKCRRSVERSC
jgi:hypothetical protein